MKLIYAILIQISGKWKSIITNNVLFILIITFPINNNYNYLNNYLNKIFLLSFISEMMKSIIYIFKISNLLLV